MKNVDGMTDANLLFEFDFYSFWAAGRVALDGGNPYDPAAMHSAQLLTGWPPEWQTHKFPYPPWALLYFLPFALLPFWLAQPVWVAATVFVLFHSAQIAEEFLAEKFGLKRLSLIGLVSVLLLFPPTLRIVLLGQSSFITAYALLLALKYRQMPIMAGMLLSITTIKPQQFMPWYAALFAGQLFSGNVKQLNGFILGSLLQLLLASLLISHPITEYLTFLSIYGEELRGYPVCTLPHFLEQGFAFANFRKLFMLGALLGGAVLGALIRPSTTSMYLIGLPLALLISPYHWLHDLASLLLPFMFIAKQRSVGSIALLIVVGLAGLLAMLSIESEALTAPLTLLILITALWYQRNALGPAHRTLTPLLD